MWAPVAERLAVATVPSVAVDLPGLGESPLPDGAPDLATAAGGVLAVLDELGIDRAVVAGVSMGGYVALALLRDNARRVAGLALVDTKSEADGDEARANRERIATAVEGEAGTRALSPMLDGLLGATTRAVRPDVVERVRAGLLAARPAGVAWSQRAMAARPATTGLLPGVRVPAAVIVGGEDGLTPPVAAHAMAQALPDAVLTVLPRAGHLSPLEDPDGVAAALLALVLRVR
jgi:pimeloyl-ACP methyl ester carboxylesterase